MATPDEIQQQLAQRKAATVTPVGDVPAATARAAAPSPLTVPPSAPTAQATAAAPAAQAALPRPPDFIGDAAGNVQANTASAGWRSAPGAQRTFFPSQGPTSSAAQLTSAPNWQTSPGAGAPAGVVDPVAATRAVQVPAATNAGAGISLEGAPKPAPIGGEDITADFTKRAAAARAGVDAGGTPRGTPLSPGEAAAARETLTAAPGAAPTAASPAGGAAAADTAAASANRSFRLTPAAETATAAEAAAPGLVRRALGAAGRVAGTLGAPIMIANGVNEAGAAVGNIRDVGANATNVGDLAAGVGNTLVGGSLAKSAAARLLTGAGATRAAEVVGTKVLGRAIPVVGAAAAGWDVGRAIAPSVNRAADAGSGISDTIGGTVNQIVHGAGKLIGQNWGADERDQENFARANSTAYANELAGRKPWQNAPAASATPVAGAATAAAPGATMSAADAMKSTTPGTAVINGRVYTPEEIADAGKRLNTVPSAAFTNPAIGTLFSEANGGATPTMDQAMALRQQLNGGGGGGRMFGTDAAGNPVGTSGAGIGGPAQMPDRASTIKDLMGQIHSALQSGRRRTANVLVSQLAAFDRASGGDAELAQRRAEAAQGPRRAPQTAAEQALETAQAEGAGSQAQVAKISVAQAKQAATIQQQLQTETDPAKRKTLQQNLSAITGKGGASAADKLMTLDIPVGSGLDAKVLKLPYDPSSNQLRVPNGYAELLQRLSGGQPQAK